MRLKWGFRSVKAVTIILNRVGCRHAIPEDDIG